MAKTRKQLQEQRNKAVVKQRQAKLKSGIGSPAHRKAIATTKSLGAKMRARVAANDKSKAAFVITVGNVDEYVKSDGTLKQKTSVAPSGSTTSTGTTTTTGGGTTIPVWREGVRTRGGYDPDTMIDYTNTNPAYWTSVISYYKAHENGNPATGELGIWIPNFEKEGAERTALAAIAGGVRAYTNSNYANRTVTDAGRAVRVNGSLTAKGSQSYRGTTKEKAIRLAGTHRGGTDVTGAGIGPMGSTTPSEHGVHILGGKVVKDAGVDYVKGGGDFGGLLGLGDAVTGDWLTGVLGGMDKDGMRIRGTYPAVAGATGSGIGAGGTKTTVGGLYSGGADPIGSMPAVADYTAYMDPNSMFGGLSENAAVRSGLLYQPEKLNYGAKMEAAGMPAFSPGLLGSFSGAGSPKYGSTPGSFMKPKVATTASSSSSLPIGSPLGTYAYPDTMFGYKSSLFPKYTSYDALTGASGYEGGTGPWSYMTKGGTPAAIVGPSIYTWSGMGDWAKHGTYDPVKAT